MREDPAKADSAWSGFLQSRRGRFLRALSHRTFVVIWIAMLVHQVGFWISMVSLQWLVSDMTGANSTMLGLLWFFLLIPLLIFSPLGGVLADRYDRKRLVVLTQFAVAGLASLLAVLTWAGLMAPAPLFVLAFCIGTTLALNAPASQAVIANAVPPADLSSAISLTAAAVNLTRVAGPALAAPVLLRWGAAPAFAIYGLSAVVTGAALARIRLRPVAYATEVEAGLFERLRSGFTHIRERKPALAVLGLLASMAVFGLGYTAMLPVFAYRVLERGDEGFMLLMVCTGVGAMVGALASGHREDAGRVSTVAMQTVLLSVALIAFALSTDFLLSLALITLIGGLGFATTTTLNALLQHIVDEDKRGRVMSIFMICWGGLVPIGGLALGLWSEVVGPASGLVTFAVVCGLLAVVLGTRAWGTRNDPVQEGAREAWDD